MYTNAVLEIGTEQSVGVSVAEIGFGEKGELVKIVNALYIVGCNALFVHQVTVIFHVLINVLDLLYEFFGLKCSHFLARHCFNFFLEISLFRHFVVSFLLHGFVARSKGQTKTSSASEKEYRGREIISRGTTSVRRHLTKTTFSGTCIP